MPSEATEHARTLFGFFKSTDLTNPGVFAAAVSALLAQYPRSVVAKVCGPFGLCQRAKFLPSISEVRQALDDEMAPIIRQREREARYGETRLLLAGPLPETPEQRAQTIANVKAKYGDDWGISVVSGAERAPVLTPEQQIKQAEDRLESLKVENQKPVVIGPRLAKILNEMRSDLGLASQMAAE